MILLRILHYVLGYLSESLTISHDISINSTEYPAISSESGILEDNVLKVPLGCVCGPCSRASLDTVILEGLKKHQRTSLRILKDTLGYLAGSFRICLRVLMDILLLGSTNILDGTERPS